MSSKEQVAIFIQSSFRSVWSLELLLLLKKDDRFWTHEEILQALRASELIVTQSLQALSAAGLVAVDEEDRAAYRPFSARTAALVDEAEQYYGQSPDAVRRLIVGSSTSGLAAFADAFKLRKD